MADIRYQNTTSTDYSELEVLFALKENIFKSLKVGSFAQVKSINQDDNTAMVTLFPAYNNETEITISTIFTKTTALNVDDIVVVLFLDVNFKQSLRQAIRKEKRTKLNPQNVILHHINYGVIIANMTSGYTPGPGPTPSDMEPITDSEIDKMFN